MVERPTRRTRDLKLPGRDAQLGSSFHQAERHLHQVAGQHPGLIPLTHVDMERFPPPPDAVAGFEQAVRDNVDVFTAFHGDGAIRRLLAPRISGFLGVEVDPESELAITAGTQSALFSVLAALIETGDTVLLPDPDYVSSERMIRFLGADVQFLPQRLTDSGLALDLGEVEQALRDGVRLVVFSHPCNPTGAVYDRDFLAGLAALVVRYDAYVIVDELYSRLVYDVPFHHMITEPGMRERCITTLGTSKTESMSGYRVGCVVAPPDIIDELIDIVSITSLRASGYAQHALRGWLETDQDWMSERLATFRELRDQTVEHLARFDFLDVVTPMGTAYVFPRVKGLSLNDFQVSEALIEKAGVLVYPGVSFGPSGAGCFRLCFAQDERKLPDILDRVTTALESLY